MSKIEKTLLIVIGYTVYLSFFAILGYWCFNPSWKIFGLTMVVGYLNNNIYAIREKNNF
jgi:hypothetical protein